MRIMREKNASLQVQGSLNVQEYTGMQNRQTAATTNAHQEKMQQSSGALQPEAESGNDDIPVAVRALQGEKGSQRREHCTDTKMRRTR